MYPVRKRHGFHLLEWVGPAEARAVLLPASARGGKVFLRCYLQTVQFARQVKSHVQEILQRCCVSTCRVRDSSRPGGNYDRSRSPIWLRIFAVSSATTNLEPLNRARH